jgi:hypothetical protein
MGGCDTFKDVPGAVAGLVIQYKHFKKRVILRKQRSNAVGDAPLFIAGRDEDRDLREHIGSRMMPHTAGNPDIADNDQQDDCLKNNEMKY